MKNKKRFVIIGATSAIAKECARLWLSEQPAELILVGRDACRLERVAADLQVRCPKSDIRIFQANCLDVKAINDMAEWIADLGVVDVVLIAHGSLPEQSICQNDLIACREVLDVNGISPVLYAEAFAKRMEKTNHGTIALISSVAGDRGRKSNYVYGAAKGMVSCYAQGLQHRFAGTGVKVVLIKPGPTDTPMTAHLKSKGVKLASSETVAKQIIKGIAAGKHVIYTPRQWWLIMAIIRNLPSVIFNKLNV